MKRLALALLLSSGSVYASPILVTSPSSLNLTDVVNWAQFGGDKTSVASNFSASTSSLSNSGFSETLTGSFTNGGGLIASAGVDASIAPGIVANDALLTTNTNGLADGVTFNFAGAYGGGAYFEVPGASSFVAHIQAFSGVNRVLDTYYNVPSNIVGDVFLGVLDDTADITSVFYSFNVTNLWTGATSPSNFQLDKFYLQNSTLSSPPLIPPIVQSPGVAAVPEPGVISLMSLGCIGLAWKLRNRAKSA